jgi:ribosome maturation factor RimP
MIDSNDKVTAIITPVIEDLGYELVRVTYGGSDRPILQIMAERPDGTMLVDDCAKISRELSAVLDVEDPIGGEYSLEVSSPGMDRPLTRMKDFVRFKGFEARIETSQPQMGVSGEQRRFKGRMQVNEDGQIIIDVDGKPFSFDFDDIVKAKLILTDDLIKYFTTEMQDTNT